MKFKTVCYLLVQLMHCRKMFKAEIPFSDAVACEGGDKVGPLCLSSRRHSCSVRPRCFPAEVLVLVALFCVLALHALLSEFTLGSRLLSDPALG